MENFAQNPFFVDRWDGFRQTLRYWPWDISCSDSLTLSVLSFFSVKRNRKEQLRLPSSNHPEIYVLVLKSLPMTTFIQTFINSGISLFIYCCSRLNNWKINSGMCKNHVLSTHFCRTPLHNLSYTTGKH